MRKPALWFLGEVGKAKTELIMTLGLSREPRPSQGR